MGLGEIRLGEMGLGEMGQNPFLNGTSFISGELETSTAITTVLET